jgi:formate dehydrogenase beta subunit
VLSSIYFSTWQGEIVDNREAPAELKESSFKLPFKYEEKDSKAFIGWDGVAIFDKDVDVVKLASTYALQYQKYSEACGRCAPGRWGGRILFDLLDKIARGEGTLSDLEHIRETASTMSETSKCEIGRTVAKPILDLILHFEDRFVSLISEKKSSPKYSTDDTEYKAKVTAPCMDMCPAHVDIPAYIEGVRDLRFENSLKATRKTMPLAHSCGRVCPHPCEDACRRANLDEAISIMELKRIGADYEDTHSLGWFHPQKQKPKIGKKVAIIGSGPAGLTGAYYLALDGVDCDVYEELPVLGGEVAVGVPEYRMPIGKYNQDIDVVKALGVNFITNTRVDDKMMAEFEESYDAVLVATGTRLSKKIRANNERPEINGYWPAIPFLDQINLFEKYGIGENVDLTGKTVVCVGGGFTSMDVVRCAVRANAKKVIMIYRRDEKTIIRNTSYEEYHEACEENIEFLFQTAIEDIITDDKDNLKELKVNKFELVQPEGGGRAQLVKIEGADFVLEADYLIPAVSQDADLSLLPKDWEIEMTSWRTIKTDGKTYMTNREGIFAAGDCEYGPMTIVNAVGQAKRAASVMSRYLKTGEITLSDDEIMEDSLRRLKVYNKSEEILGWMSGLKREVSEKLAVSERIDNNREVNFGFTNEEALRESERCMRCYYIAMTAI